MLLHDRFVCIFWRQDVCEKSCIVMACEAYADGRRCRGDRRGRSPGRLAEDGGVVAIAAKRSDGANQ